MSIGIAAMDAVAFVLGDGYWLGFPHASLAGVFVLAVTVTVTVTGLLVFGTTFQLSGTWGEDNTRDVLRPARRRGLPHGWVDNLEVGGGHVDHLVVAPGRCSALDSTWHSPGLSSYRIEGDVAAARASARRARPILRSMHQERDVGPVVVVWGRDQRDVLGGRVRDRVVFVAGSELRRWLDQRVSHGSAITIDRGRAVLQELQHVAARVRPADRPLAKDATTR